MTCVTGAYKGKASLVIISGVCGHYGSPFFIIHCNVVTLVLTVSLFCFLSGPVVKLVR